STSSRTAAMSSAEGTRHRPCSRQDWQALEVGSTAARPSANSPASLSMRRDHTCIRSARLDVPSSLVLAPPGLNIPLRSASGTKQQSAALILPYASPVASGRAALVIDQHPRAVLEAIDPIDAHGERQAGVLRGLRALLQSLDGKGRAQALGGQPFAEQRLHT